MLMMMKRLIVTWCLMLLLIGSCTTPPNPMFPSPAEMAQIEIEMYQTPLAPPGWKHVSEKPVWHIAGKCCFDSISNTMVVFTSERECYLMKQIDNTDLYFMQIDCSQTPSPAPWESWPDERWETKLELEGSCLS